MIFKSKKKKTGNSGAGFTLVEILVAIIIFIIAVGAIYAGYSLSQRAYLEGEISAEITQNARVILERMTREIRQAREIVTDLPDSAEDAFNQIEFEDGHHADRYRYIRYFQDNNKIKREVKAYYFSGKEGVFVPWNAVPPPGEFLEEETLEEARTIGELVVGLRLWIPEARMVNVSVSLGKHGKQAELSTGIFGRNL